MWHRRQTNGRLNTIGTNDFCNTMVKNKPALCVTNYVYYHTLLQIAADLQTTFTTRQNKHVAPHARTFSSIMVGGTAS